jgi:hypothetical protein
LIFTKLNNNLRFEELEYQTLGGENLWKIVFTVISEILLVFWVKGSAESFNEFEGFWKLAHKRRQQH